jgi:UDP-N-acetylglucosamine acyltransferase
MNKTTIDPTAQIHPTAIINDGAIIGKDVNIGPYCVIGKNVILDDGVRLVSHVCVDGITHIGAESLVYPFASIGHNPQDLKFNGEPSTVTIGKKTTIREYVTIQPGTEGGGMKTTVGDGCLLMVGVHVAHDCHVGNNVVMANYATLAGHVFVADHVIIGGLSAIKQFVRIGAYAMIGGMSGVEKDVVPYALVMGERANLHGVNILGMKRHGFSNAVIQRVQAIYKNVFIEDDESPFQLRVKKQRAAPAIEGQDHVTQVLFDFMDGETKCHFTMAKNAR